MFSCQSQHMILTKQKSEDQDWIEEAVLEQRTKVFEVYGAVNRLERVFLMDSVSKTNCVSDSLVSYLHPSTEYIDHPYHVPWINQEYRTYVTKRCLVNFMIGAQISR